MNRFPDAIVEAEVFGLQIIGRADSHPANPEYVRVMRSIHWVHAAFWNYCLGRHGLREFRDKGIRAKWPQSHFCYYAGITFYFAMLDNIAICVHQRYRDDPEPRKILFRDPRDWSKEIPKTVKMNLNKICEHSQWADFKENFRHAIIHRIPPLLHGEEFEIPGYIQMNGWPRIREEHVVFEDNPHLTYAQSTDPNDDRWHAMWPDDKLETHLVYAYQIIRELCKEIYTLQYMWVEEINPKTTVR